MFLGLVIMFALRPAGMIDIQCSGPLRAPRIVIFTDGTAEVTTREGAVSRLSIPPEELLFLQTMSANAMTESTGWLSYVPEELRELAVTLADGDATRTVPAYVRREGIPPSIAIDKDNGRTRLEMVVDETSTAAGCPGLFDTCQ